MQYRLLALSLLAACSNTSGNTSVACKPLAQQPVQRDPAWSGPVVTIVMENKSVGDIIGNKDAPYINSLVKTGALARGYHDSFVHPSEPNYFWMAAGQNFGILDDMDPAIHHIHTGSHIADQIEAAGLTWKTYQESMGAPCGMSSSGKYAAKHNPFIYFDDINGWDGSKFTRPQRCIDHVVDYSMLQQDLNAGTLPDYVFITPNLDDDMHDGSVAHGDAWLSQEVPKILASSSFAHGGVVFLLWDEGSGTVSQSDDPPFIAIGPNVKKGFESTTDYDTSSYLRTVQRLLQLEQLPCGEDPKTPQTMDDLFTAPMPAPATAPAPAAPAAPAAPNPVSH